MMHSLLDQFIALWPDRALLSDRFRVAHHDRAAGFGDKFWNSAYGVLQMWEDDVDLMPPAKFRALFGIHPKDLRFLCHACRKDAATREGVYGLSAPTAYSLEMVSRFNALHSKSPRPPCERNAHGQLVPPRS